MIRTGVVALSLTLVLYAPATGVAAVAMPSAAQAPPAAAQGTLRADFNADGWGDLAIGVQGETVDGVFRAGAVQVVYGSSDGLRAAGNQLWSQNSPGIEGAAEADDLFGTDVAAGDFDGDGFDDVAISAPFEDLAGIRDAGLVHVLYGSPNGLRAERSQSWSQGSTGIAGSREDGDDFGLKLAVGQLGRGPAADLAVGSPGESVGQAQRSGAVHVLYGSPQGLSAAGNQVWHQNSPGVAGAAEEGDGFGSSLAAADVGGPSGTDDLAIGVPTESLGDTYGAGGVHVLRGSTGGLTAAGSQLWNLNSPGIAGAAVAGDSFGSSIAAADFGRSGHADLAITVSWRTISGLLAAGEVHVLYGSAAGLSAKGSQVWNQRSAGVRGVPEQYDLFGLALATGNFGGGPQADLAIGVPGEDPPGEEWFGAGAVQVLYGSTSGLRSDRSQLLTQDTPGVAEVGEFVDWFGSSLAGGTFGGDGYDDLAVGARSEVLEDREEAGVVHVLPGGARGMTSAGSSLWHQGASGLPGVVQAWDNFGNSLAGGLTCRAR